MTKFGFGSTGLIAEDFLTRDNVIQLEFPPHRIDLMTTSDGLEFKQSFKRRNEVDVNGIIIPYVSLKDLITNKKTTARPQDLADAHSLIKINNLEEE